MPEEAQELAAKVLRAGVAFGSHFSGVGMSEWWSEQVDKAARELATDPDLQDDWRGVVHQYAFEREPGPRGFLLGHRAGPQHVHGDLLSTWDESTVQSLTDLQKTVGEQFKQRVRAGEPVPQVREDLTDSFTLSAEAVLAKGMLKTEAWCFKHKQICKLRDFDAGQFHSRGGLTVNVCTSMCIEHSSTGAKRGATGETGVAFCAWAAERRRLATHGAEDVILHECTQHHPSNKLLTFWVGETHLVFDWVLSPDDFAFPCTRHRRMAACIGKWLVSSWIPVERPVRFCADPLCMHEVGPSFWNHAATATGIIYFSADKDCLARHIAHLAKEGNNGEPDDPSEFEWRRLLTPPLAHELLSYEAAFAVLRPTAQNTGCTVFNLNQRAMHFFPHPNGKIPALLTRSSRLWCQEVGRSGRWLLPEEALQVMGFDLADLPWDPEACMGKTFATGAGHIHQYAGDGIHLAVGGSLFLWALTSHKRVAAASSAATTSTLT